MAAAVAVPIFTALLGAGATVASGMTTANAAKRAERGRKEAQGKLESEQMRREQEAALEQERNIDRAKKKTKAGVAGGRADTILTSPLGVVDGQASAGKTLLGQ
jgi:hypothetical protein